jgi:pimeloyl-ACP methyl ester carboxylesterase
MRKVAAAVGGACAACGAFLSFRWFKRTREDKRWEDAKYPGKLLNIEGVTLHYEEKGSGQPFVMVHGFGGSTFSFRYQIEEFSRDYRCIAIDLKGFGYSERQKGGDYSLTEQARLVLRALDLLGVDRFILMGHSMGGDVSMRIAAMSPERVEKLILAATANGMKMWVMPRLPFMKPVLNFFIRASAPRHTRRLFYDNSAVDHKEIIEGYRQTHRIKGSRNTVWEMWNGIRADKPIEYKRIRMPTLILWAEKDLILPLPGLGLWWLRRKLRHAEVVKIPRTGHLLLEERPDAANAALRRFLQGASEEQVREAALAVA